MKKLKQEPCLECSKIGTFCKQLCQACYSKKLRNTPEGRLKMKSYNDTKRIEARSKKPPKAPKQNCECGKPSVSKNMCMSCYQRKRYYQIKRYDNKEVPIRITYDGNKIFSDVLLQVKKGFTIFNACKKAGIKSSTLYRLITPLQKAELNAYKILRDLDEYEFLENYN